MLRGAQHSHFLSLGKLFSGGKVWNNAWFPTQ